jgi:hypothetical protein
MSSVNRKMDIRLSVTVDMVLHAHFYDLPQEFADAEANLASDRPFSGNFYLVFDYQLRACFK